MDYKDHPGFIAFKATERKESTSLNEVENKKESNDSQDDNK